ncbi:MULTISPECIES: alpha/beta hydrolase [Kitasatospora]|uniref:Putative esterase n=1 Tax=Kitasatospora setae (strain ATCC 33774 / DSM 43861 / JCM 3304 / KCC A-0304 / NBRC 14216 / KM-6054) TaxID=452652 RepID=E4NE89_KITSK|nr:MULTISPECIES: alpha/beta hydrolase [Kitasatospora]BAJ29520.1 putative esterase [Kitasatospora setae KM-6054]
MTVYRGFDQRELDREYSPSSKVADLGAEIAAYAEQSRRAHRELSGHRELRYGPQAPELIDYFPAAGRAEGAGTPLHVFVHGGYWQELGKEDAAFPALDFVPRGTAFAAVGYGLAPRWPVERIAGQVVAAVRWLLDHAAELGADPARVVLGGSSAGAHLAARALLDPAVRGRVRGAALLSGVYDLEPISLSYVNRPLGLDADRARRLSPLHAGAAALTGLPPVVLALGEHETGEFGRQGAEFAAALRAAGVPVRELLAAGRNHFDLVFDLGRPDTALGAAVAELDRPPAGGRPEPGGAGS